MGTQFDRRDAERQVKQAVDKHEIFELLTATEPYGSLIDGSDTQSGYYIELYEGVLTVYAASNPKLKGQIAAETYEALIKMIDTDNDDLALTYIKTELIIRAAENQDLNLDIPALCDHLAKKYINFINDPETQKESAEDNENLFDFRATFGDLFSWSNEIAHLGGPNFFKKIEEFPYTILYAAKHKSPSTQH